MKRLALLTAMLVAMNAVADPLTVELDSEKNRPQPAEMTQLDQPATQNGATDRCSPVYPVPGQSTGQEPTAAEESSHAETLAGRIDQGKKARAAGQAYARQALSSDFTLIVNKVGDRLLAQMTEEDNPVVSGVGVALLLDALWQGADGDSKSQIQDWLYGHDGEGTINVSAVLQHQNKALQQIAAMLIPHKDIILPAYKEALSSEGFILANNLDDLNGQVAKLTDGAISEVLNSLDPNTRMVLVHALHFSAPWKKQFNKARTHQYPFFALQSNGEVVEQNVDMMFQTLEAGFIEDQDYVGLSLPFVDDYVLVLAMPKVEQSSKKVLGNAQQWLHQQRLNLLTSRAEKIDLYLPKWTLKQEHNLIPLLQSEGIKAVFSSTAAQLPGISSQESLYVDQFKQDIQIQIDEEGGEASAATTAVVVTRGISIDSNPIVVIDRPFVYSIVNTNNGLNILSGYLRNPNPTTNMAK